jgi:hypothetical protein
MNESYFSFIPDIPKTQAVENQSSRIREFQKYDDVQYASSLDIGKYLGSDEHATYVKWQLSGYEVYPNHSPALEQLRHFTLEKH